jgi:hypothetical protein
MVIERDDGFIAVDGTDYFGGLAEHDQCAVAHAEGRVLDVGADAGRGRERCRPAARRYRRSTPRRARSRHAAGAGVRSAYQGTARQAAAGGLAGTFDSALLVGNNLGLLGSRENAALLLSDLGRLLKPGGVIVGTILDPCQTGNPVHLAYDQRNMDLGRMPGQLTMRVRYENIASTWFDWLAASPAETAELAAAAGWEVAGSFPGISHAAVLRRA